MEKKRSKCLFMTNTKVNTWGQINGFGYVGGENYKMTFEPGLTWKVYAMVSLKYTPQFQPKC